MECVFPSVRSAFEGDTEFDRLEENEATEKNFKKNKNRKKTDQNWAHLLKFSIKFFGVWTTVHTTDRKKYERSANVRVRIHVHIPVCVCIFVSYFLNSHPWTTEQVSEKQSSTPPRNSLDPMKNFENVAY